MAESRTLDDSTRASQPGGIALSKARLRRMRPDLFGWGAFTHAMKHVLGGKKLFPRVTYLEEQLMRGDGRAAIVMSVEPLLVAAFTSEIDCVAMLKFDPTQLERVPQKGERLLTVNTYGRGTPLQADLTQGPHSRGYWTRFHPLIADFLTEDMAALAARKSTIAEDEWRYAEALGLTYLHDRPGVARDGRPMFSQKSAL